MTDPHTFHIARDAGGFYIALPGGADSRWYEPWPPHQAPRRFLTEEEAADTLRWLIWDYVENPSEQSWRACFARRLRRWRKMTKMYWKHHI